MKFIGIFLVCNLASIFSSPVGKISDAIGGVVVESISYFPYQTVIFARFDSGSKLCSGAILSSRLIITCAHCLVGSTSASFFYGSENLSALDFSKNQIVDSANYRIHPQYSKYINDVALILTNVEIEFNGELNFFLTSGLVINFFINRQGKAFTPSKS